MADPLLNATGNLIIEFAKLATAEAETSQQEIAQLKRDNGKLRKALHDMLQCRDVGWEASGGGHDWKPAVDAAIAVLDEA